MILVRPADLLLCLRRPSGASLEQLSESLKSGCMTVSSRVKGWLFVVSKNTTDPDNPYVLVEPNEDLLKSLVHPWQGKYFLSSPLVCLASDETGVYINYETGQFYYEEVVSLVDGCTLTFKIESSLFGVTPEKVAKKGNITWYIFIPNSKTSIVIQMNFDLNDDEFYISTNFKGDSSKNTWPNEILNLLKILLPIDSTMRSWEHYCDRESFSFPETGFVKIGALEFLINFFVDLQTFVSANTSTMRQLFGSLAMDLAGFTRSNEVYVVPASSRIRDRIKI